MITLDKKCKPCRPAAGHGLTSSTSSWSLPMFERPKERYGERQGWLHPESFARCPSRDRCRDGHHRAGLSALRRIALCPPIRRFSILRVAAPNAQSVSRPPLRLALARLDPLRPWPCVAAGRTDSGCMRPGQVVISTPAPRIPRPPLAERHSMVRCQPTVRVRAAA